KKERARLKLSDALLRAGYRAVRRVDCEPATVLHVEPHPASDPVAAKSILRRVEVEIPVEAAPRRPALQAERERRCEQRVQSLTARDVPAELSHAVLRTGGAGTPRSRRAPRHPRRWRRRARRAWSSS